MVFSPFNEQENRKKKKEKRKRKKLTIASEEKRQRSFANKKLRTRSNKTIDFLKKRYI